MNSVEANYVEANYRVHVTDYPMRTRSFVFLDTAVRFLEEYRGMGHEAHLEHLCPAFGTGRYEDCADD